MKTTTELFKDENINRGYKITESDIIRNNKGIYQLICLDWPIKYIGQRDRVIITWFKEHIQR
jgi:hypothetical protein